MADKSSDGEPTKKADLKKPSKDPISPDQTAETVIQDNMTAETMLQGNATAKTQIQSDGMDTIMEPDQTLETLMKADQTKETAILSGRREEAPTVKAPAHVGSPKTKSSSADSEYKYEVIKSLGKGGFAWVYLVRNLALDRLEAIKILNSELTEDEEVLNRFVKEARLSANFNHQNIVMVYEVQKLSDWALFSVSEKIKGRHKEPFAYFTMSFVEGDTATNLIKKQGRLSQVQAVSIARNMASALDYAHGKGVVHRDIKPDNVLVNRKGQGIVMDFGIAKAADQTRKTAAGTFMGTARYVSPEQAMGKEIDGRSDIYSLGITLYELVTGNVPFSSDQWMTVLYQHINEPPPAPEKYYEGIDRDLRAVILKMLEKKPEDRYQTARELLEALNGIHRQLGGAPRQTEALDHIETRRDFAPEQNTSATEMVQGTAPPVRTKVEGKSPLRGKSKKKPFLVPMGVLALAALAAIVYFAMIRPAPEPPTKPPPTVPVTTSTLLVSAFPTGELIKILDDQGEEIAVEKATLPQFLTLPEGTYSLFISYQGQTMKMEAHVLNDVPLSKTNAEFPIEESRFLLEDMQ